MNRRGFLAGVLGLLAAPIVAMVPEFKPVAVKAIERVDPLAFCMARNDPLGCDAGGNFHFHGIKRDGSNFCFVGGPASSVMTLAC